MDTQNKILDTNPTKYIVAGLVVIILFFGGLAAWSIFFPFQGAVIASGVGKVSGERKVVQHLEGGIVEKIYVNDGNKVEKGDLLIELQSSQIRSNVELFQGQLWAKQAEEARLRAEASGKSKITWPSGFKAIADREEIVQLKATETDIFNSKRSDMAGKTELYLSQIKQLGNRIAGAREELASTEVIIKNLEEDLRSKRPLLKNKYLGKGSILELERSLATYKGRKGKLNQDIAEYNQMIQESRLRIVDMVNQYKEKAVSRLGEVSDTVFQIREQIKPHLDARERLLIRAPISGVVINMQVHSEASGVITPRMPLLEIVPAEMSMVIEARVRPQDIISVKKGQETKVQLSAFQRNNTPPIQGEVTYVSADLMNPQADRGVMPYYEVHVLIDQADLAAKNAYLSPGMPVACYITTDERTIISYLLGPLLQNVDMALRE